MKKNRKTLDTKDHGGAKKGDVRNPKGKEAGTLRRSTALANETKISLIQSFQRTIAPQMLATMLNGKLPMQFVPRHIREKWARGEELSPAEDMLMVSEIGKNWKWAMDWMSKVFPKTLGIYGLIQTEETLAGRVKQATKAPKSAKVIELVKRRMEKEMFTAEE